MEYKTNGLTDILLLNNAYPTKIQPKRGGYIKSIEKCLIEANLKVDKLVMIYEKNNSFAKVSDYSLFYLKLFFCNYQKYEYVYIHHYPHLFLPLIFRFSSMKKIVINFHGGDIIYKSTFEKIINRASYLLIPKKAIFIVPSFYFKEKVIEAIPSLGKRAFHVSPSGGVDMKVFKPLKIVKEATKVNIGFASGIDLNKGIQDLLILLENLEPSKYNFHIIDYGKDRGSFINDLKSFKNVFFYQLFEKEKMPEFYCKIDVLFFPSKSESLGLVALEAMSCGVPVIGPNDYALKHIIKNGITGEKYNASIEKGYINAFNRFINNRKKYKTRNFVEDQYSKKSVIEQFKKIFNTQT